MTHSIEQANYRQTENFISTLNLFQNARSRGCKFPVLRLIDFSTERVILLRFQGPKSKHAGSIAVVSEGYYGANDFYGRIFQTGDFHPSNYMREGFPDLIQEVTDQVAAFDENPQLILADQGQFDSHCAACNRKLTTSQSKKIGLGAECQKFFSLWN